jgi:hypothetical protein
MKVKEGDVVECIDVKHEYCDMVKLGKKYVVHRESSGENYIHSELGDHRTFDFYGWKYFRLVTNKRGYAHWENTYCKKGEKK